METKITLTAHIVSGQAMLEGQKQLENGDTVNYELVEYNGSWSCVIWTLNSKYEQVNSHVLHNQTLTHLFQYIDTKIGVLV